MNPYLEFIKNTPKVATREALQAGADPQDLALAKSQLGKKEYIGYCQEFVEKASGQGVMGSSASQAWQNQQDKAVQGLEGVEPGDQIYFSNPNNPDGHVGIVSNIDQTGTPSFISATNNGIEENSLPEWEQMTGQTPLGYIPQKTNPYMNIVKGGKYGNN